MMKNKKVMKESSKGITLIALVITIIVLLILAGVSITMLTGNNSILNQTTNAREKTRGGEVQETVNIAATCNEGVDYIGGTKKTRAQVINELHAAKNLTDEEVNLLTNEENPVDVITIGGITIDFSVLGSTGSKTLGAVYDSGDLKIGDKLTYSSNGQSSWIVFGKEINEEGQETGNILITTELPIENGFNLKGGAEAWLKYESDTDTTYGLNYACSRYGETIQGTQVKSRSIKMEDINYVAGLTQKTVTVDGNTYNIQSFDTYHFGNYTNPDYSAKEVNFWYPVLTGGKGANGEGDGFWQQPTSEDEEKFDNNWYGYYGNSEDGKYYYYGAETGGSSISASTVGLNTDNLKYIWGGNTEETWYKDYLVASRSVFIDDISTRFSVAVVGGGGVFSDDGVGLCNSNSSGGDDCENRDRLGIRPVVVLPSTLLVEEKEGGTYDLAE